MLPWLGARMQTVTAELARSIADWAIGIARRDIAFAGADPMRVGIAALRSSYAARAEAMDEALRKHLGGIATWQKPQGGYFFWLRLQAQAARLVALAYGNISFTREKKVVWTFKDWKNFGNSMPVQAVLEAGK